MIQLTENSSTAEVSAQPATSDCDTDRHELAPWACSRRNAMAAADGPQRLVWGRIVALALTLALHTAALLHLTLPPPAWSPAATRDVHGPAIADTSSEWLQVVLVPPSADADAGVVAGEQILAPSSPALTPNPRLRLPATPPPSPPIPSAAEPATPTVVPSAAMPKPPAPANPRISTTLPPSPSAAAAAARLFHADGSVALPAAAIADLRAVESDDRTFDYMTPGLATAGSSFKRQTTVPYTPTRFDADWKPAGSAGEQVLLAVAEKLTYENERKTFRCSLVPPGCSWGRVDDAVELDDPHTLNPTEDAQCRALWDTMVATTNQSQWLDLRKRYGAQCRKPLEREGVPVDEDTAQAVSVPMRP